jgi:hypothetical protein
MFCTSIPNAYRFVVQMLQEFGGRVLTAFDPNQIIQHQNEAPVQPPLAQLDEIFEDGEYSP